MQCAMKYRVIFIFSIALFCYHSKAQFQSTVKSPGGQILNENGIAFFLPDTSNPSPFVIRNIVIDGNKKTKPKIILRELPFHSGDHYQLPQLVKKFEEAREFLMNTGLFHNVVVALKAFDGYNVDILIEVRERWYIFPLPYFKPVDRNLNQWIVENKFSLTRVNYGAKVIYNNLSGNKDNLNLWLINGYTKQLSFNYARPYIDNKMKLGLNFGTALGKNREINYTTIENKQVFFKDPEHFNHSFFRGYAEAIYRPAIKTRHTLGIAYSKEEVGDTVIKLNPNYFSGGRHSVTYPEIYYTMSYFDLDYIPYPTHGYAAEVSLSKKGFNNVVNVWQISAKGSANYSLFKKTYLNLSAYASVKYPFKQPFYSREFLGYDEINMQGYEYYVVDGAAGGYLKAAVTRELFSFKIRVPENRFSSINHVPFHVFAKIYGNTGYVHNPQPGMTNFLENRMLYTGGIGIDVLTIYDFTMKFEWSFNQLGQNGLFLQKKSYF